MKSWKNTISLVQALPTLSTFWKSNNILAPHLLFGDAKVFGKKSIVSEGRPLSVTKSAITQKDILTVNCQGTRTETVQLLDISLALLPVKISSSGQTSQENHSKKE